MSEIVKTPPGKAVAKKITPFDEVRQNMQRMEGQFKLVLPGHITPERFIRVVLTALQNNPDLIQCERQSLYSAAMLAAQDGLLPDGREGAIVPYRLKGVLTAKWMPMTWGILKKIRNSGELSTIKPEVVCEGDQFELWTDEQGDHLRHVPNLTGPDRGPLLLAYCLARTKDGGIYIEAMTRAQVYAIRDVSRAKDTGPWSGDFESEMWKKSVLRRLSKRLPMSTDVDELLRRDDDLYELPGKQEALAKPETAQLPNPSGQPGPQRLRGLLVSSNAELEQLPPQVENNNRDTEKSDKPAAEEPNQLKAGREDDH